MKITNQSFPHPVLGIQDDIAGKFDTNLTWNCDRAFYYLYPVFNLQNENIEKLIIENLASFVVHIECGNTFFRKSYMFNNRTPEIRIPADKLRDRVEVGFYISAIGAIGEYVNKDAHDDYSGQKFSIDKGDILAYGGDTSFYAVKNYESLKAVSSIMVIKKANYEKGIAKVNYNNDKIELWLSKENFNIYNENKNDEHFGALFHTSLVLPILLKALAFIKDDDPDFKTFKWFDVLKIRIDDESLGIEDDEKHFEVIQKLFGNPIDRFFLSINHLNEALYSNG